MAETSAKQVISSFVSSPAHLKVSFAGHAIKLCETARKSTRDRIHELNSLPPMKTIYEIRSQVLGGDRFKTAGVNSYVSRLSTWDENATDISIIPSITFKHNIQLIQSAVQ